MKKLLMTSLLVTAVSTTASADAVTCKFLDKYLGTNGAVFHDNPVMQCDLFVDLPKGFYVDLWASYGAQGSWQSTFGDEWDLTLGYADTVGSFNIDVAVAYFNISNAGNATMANVFQFYLDIDHPIMVGKATLSPFARFEAYVPSKSGDNPDNGQVLRSGMKYSLPLSEKWSLSGKAQVSYDSGAFGFPSGTFADVDAKTAYQVSEQLSLAFYGKYATTVATKFFDSRGTETAFGIIASWSL